MRNIKSLIKIIKPEISNIDWKIITIFCKPTAQKLKKLAIIYKTEKSRSQQKKLKI